MTKENGIKYGVLHCHTENSVKDSCMSARTLALTAKSLGAPAVTLTDHGVLTGVFEFMEACKIADIKGIPGVEAYIEEDALISKRSHLILLPKNYEGFKAISKAVTKSNDRMSGSFARMNMEILKECFGEGSEGHGNVFVTSACMQGVLSTILLKNQTVEMEIAKQEQKQKKYANPNDASYTANKALLEKAGEEIKALIEEREYITKIANRKFASKEKALASLEKTNVEEAKVFKTALEKEKEETRIAQTRLDEVKSEITRKKKQETQIRKKVKDAEATHDKWLQVEKIISDMRKETKSSHEIFREALVTAKEYETLFGKGNFFIELQYHGIREEEIVMPILARIAEELGLPTCAANDAHMPDNSPDSIRARRIVNSLRFNKWEDERVGDTELYIKTDEELEASLLKILTKEQVEKAMKGIEEIVSNCEVIFPEKKHYPRFLNDEGKVEDTKARLRRLAEKNIPIKYPNWTKELQKRFDYELDIIDKAGYNDYLCIVEDFLNYGRKLGKDNPEGVGLGVGSGRGSAAGSLVCYLVGITGIDPIKYGLIFERFLNLERVSSPKQYWAFNVNSIAQGCAA